MRWTVLLAASVCWFGVLGGCGDGSGKDGAGCTEGATQGCLGCDGVMGSGAALDECGECEGPGARPWYYDADDDGIGVQSITVLACSQPEFAA